MFHKAFPVRAKLVTRLGSALVAALVVATVGTAATFAPSTVAAVSGHHHPDHHGHDNGGAPPTITSSPVGTVHGGQVNEYTLTNANGMTVKIFNYGGIIQSITFPDRSGNPADLVLGFPTLQDYVNEDPAANPNNPGSAGVYFGALIGRYANRIAAGKFTLDGTSYQVPINNGPNALHGGTIGFDQKVWTPTVLQSDRTAALQLEYVSPNGEMGFPGTLDTIATYTLDNDNRLTLTFHATTDAPTVVNLTNHTYWNLAGESSGTVYDQKLWINADSYTPVNLVQIPTGQISPVAGTPFDFTSPTPIGQNINVDNPQLLIGQGYDLNWVLNKPAPDSLSLAARAWDPSSGRELSVYTTQPGLQFYSGNFLAGTLVGISGHIYRQSDGFALETQHFPDSPNVPSFPSTELDPGQVYSQTTVFKLSN
ncbi:MAG: galactose-epimerase [Acidimicrobiaceae bacterium]|nr:galactose-epimerase [Acidimicrobiaceae bacterium]